MPNHITNYITFIGNDRRVKGILKEIAVPKPVHWQKGNNQSDGYGYLVWGVGTFDFNSIVQQPENLEDWHSWNCANWGVKWNAYYNERISVNKIKFYTAWSDVLELVIQLSEKYPDVTIEYKHWSEDVGGIVGSYILKAGEVIEENVPKEYSKEAYELIFEIENCYADDFGMAFDEEQNNYIWKD